jgi:putative DNA primase/helicase
VDQWLEECCVVGPKLKERSSLLFGSWQTWCDKHGERPGHQRAFNDALEQRGFKRFKQESGKVFRGLAVARRKPT